MQAALDISLYMNTDKTQFKSFNQDGTISALNDKPLKLVDQFLYLSSNIASTESNANICIGKWWTVFARLTTIWKSDLSDELKLEFFQVVAVSELLYSCTTWTQTKCFEKKTRWELHTNAVLNKSRKQYPTKQQLYSHLLPIPQIIQVRWARSDVHCWGN